MLLHIVKCIQNNVFKSYVLSSMFIGYKFEKIHVFLHCNIHFRILHPVKYYRDFMSYDIRPDGRDLLKFRPAIVNVGSISTADGSILTDSEGSPLITGSIEVTVNLCP